MEEKQRVLACVARQQRVDIRVIQDLLGHRNIASTTRYTSVAVEAIRQIQTPLELPNIGLTPPA